MVEDSKIEPRTFTHDSKPVTYSRPCTDKMQQWGLDQTAKLARFHFDGRFRKQQLGELVQDFFSNPAVLEALPMETTAASTVKSVKWKPLATTVVNMEFFDRLETSGVVSQSGYIRKQMEEFYDGIGAPDSLRDMLMNEDSDHAGVYSEAEQDEFLHHIFKRVSVGGGICQHDENVNPMMGVTKELYRELVNVHRSAKTDEIEVSSLVVEVQAVEGDFELWNRHSVHNKCYLVVDPKLKNVTMWRVEIKTGW
jgi:hypothetical protein